MFNLPFSILSSPTGKCRICGPSEEKVPAGVSVCQTACTCRKACSVRRLGTIRKRIHRVSFRGGIMYGSTPLLFQEESLPNFIDHGKDHMKYCAKREKSSHIRYPTAGTSTKKINTVYP